VWSSALSYVTGPFNRRDTSVAVAGAGDLNAVYNSYTFWNIAKNAAPITCVEMPVPSGTYTLRLLFANIYPGTSTVGSRVFDVYVEDVRVMDNFDMVAAAGGSQKAYTRDIPITITDGGLSIGFVSQISDPQLNGYVLFQRTAAKTASGTAASQSGPDGTKTLGPDDSSEPSAAADFPVAAVVAVCVSLAVSVSALVATRYLKARIVPALSQPLREPEVELSAAVVPEQIDASHV